MFLPEKLVFVWICMTDNLGEVLVLFLFMFICLYVGWLCLLVWYAMQRSGRYYGGGNGSCFFVMLQARLKAKTFMCWCESLTKLQSKVWKFTVVGRIREWKYGICIIGEGSEELWCASGTWSNLISLCLFWCVCDCCLLNFGVCLFPFLEGDFLLMEGTGELWL